MKLIVLLVAIAFVASSEAGSVVAGGDCTDNSDCLITLKCIGEFCCSIPLDPQFVGCGTGGSLQCHSCNVTGYKGECRTQEFDDDQCSQSTCSNTPIRGMYVSTPKVCKYGECVDNIWNGGTTAAPCADGYACLDDTTCRTNCTADVECQSTHYCDNTTTMTCIARYDQGQSCTKASDCKNWICADGYCCDSTCADACEECNNATASCQVGTCCNHQDVCGDCYGDGSECLGCDGVAGSGKTVDECGVCGGNTFDKTKCDESTSDASRVLPWFSMMAAWMGL